MKAGLIVDNWKLSVFRKRLTENGYHYKDGGAPTHDTTLLTMEFDDVDKLKGLLQRCEAECKEAKI